MSAYLYNKAKQQIIASRKGILLQSKTKSRAEKSYVDDIANNFFQFPCTDGKNEIQSGDGNEWKGDTPFKIQAVHSSSALEVNFFEYWRNKVDKTFLCKALRISTKGVSSLSFEKKFKIPEGGTSNMDVVINYNNSVCAIECKFNEPYSKREGSSGLKKVYLDNSSLWKNLPNLKKYAESISPDDTINRHLGASQLITHTLGLVSHYNDDKSKFLLFYLWYDAFGEEGYVHRKEIERFADVLKSDGIEFREMTWQEAIIGMGAKADPAHKAYIDYLCERYL